IPIINGLTDDAHPCQVLEDLMTIYEKKGHFQGLKLAFVGDGNNMSQSLLMGCAMMGMDCYVAVPEGYEVKQAYLEKAQQYAKKTRATISETYDGVEAGKGADASDTNVWTSMGQESENELRKDIFKGLQVNNELVKHAKNNYRFMHCLPAKPGEG